MIRIRNVLDCYPEPDERPAPDDNPLDSDLYASVARLEEYRKAGDHGTTPQERLNSLKEEFLRRVKIIAQQVFELGEILVEAKAECQQSGKSFQAWIKTDLGIKESYAKNMMNVYVYGLKYKPLVLKVLPSILYEIFRPTFPKLLADYLCTQGTLEDEEVKRIEVFRKAYEKGGLEYVKPLIKEKKIADRTAVLVKRFQDCVEANKKFQEQLDREGLSDFGQNPEVAALYDAMKAWNNEVLKGAETVEALCNDTIKGLRKGVASAA